MITRNSRNATTGTAPDYIAELCLPVGTQSGRRALRSASRNDLIVPSFRTTTRALRDFSIAAPRIWNTLPPSVRATNAACGYMVFSRLLTLIRTRGVWPEPPAHSCCITFLNIKLAQIGFVTLLLYC